LLTSSMEKDLKLNSAGLYTIASDRCAALLYNRRSFDLPLIK